MTVFSILLNHITQKAKSTVTLHLCSSGVLYLWNSEQFNTYFIIKIHLDISLPQIYLKVSCVLSINLQKIFNIYSLEPVTQHLAR